MNQDTIVYIDSNNVATEINLSTIDLARNNSTLLNQFINAIRSNAAHGYALYNDATYFQVLKQSWTNFKDVILSMQKYNMGERLQTDYSYSIEIAKMALLTAICGLTTLTVNGPQNISLLSLTTTNGDLDPVPDSQVQEAVITLSNTPLFFEILINRKLI